MKGIAKCRLATSQREKHGKKDDSREKEKKKGLTQEHNLLTPPEELYNNGMYKVRRDRIHDLKATTHCTTSRTELPHGMRHAQQLHRTMVADSKGVYTSNQVET